MKQLLSVATLVLLFTSVSFASFPVKDAAQTTNTETVSSEASAKADKKAARIEKKLSKKIDKIESKLAKKAEKGDDGTVAILLALLSVLIIPLAFHNWYLGKTGKATWQTILTLLIITSPISWVWQVVDTIRLLINGGSYE